MNIDVFFTIILGAVASISLILFKKANDKRFSSWTYSFWWSALAVLFIFPFALSYFEKPESILALTFLTMSALTWTLASVTTMFAFKHADASIVMLVGRLSNASIFLVGWLYIGEKIGIYAVLGLLLTLLGSLVIMFKKGSIRPSKGVLLSMVPVAFLTAAFYFDKQAVATFNPINFIFLQQLMQTVFSFFGVKNKAEIGQLFAEKKKLLIPAIACFVIGYTGFIALLGRNNLSVLPLTYETTVFLGSMMLGVIYLGEKKQLAQKVVGTILALAGVVLLSF
ncbi:MAG: hypothetical protein COY80_02980 [Candidatus Pacebacteria bacterium CG_4_10_14_0_8_um_filter_42_14]|nr:MAG: hypothetical protein COY80_02980 [Candidatus Pacebacteria bacterium CG_4_10_14_0_8_um_filter_42_14]